MSALAKLIEPSLAGVNAAAAAVVNVLALTVAAPFCA